MIDCGRPAAPVGYTIEPYTTTTVGSMVTFLERVQAVCTSNGEWMHNYNQSLMMCETTPSG